MFVFLKGLPKLYVIVCSYNTMDKSGVEIMENIWYDEKKQAVFLLSIIFRTVELETNKNWVNVLTNESNFL